MSYLRPATCRARLVWKSFRPYALSIVFAQTLFAANPNAATQPADAQPIKNAGADDAQGWPPPVKKTAARMRQACNLMLTFQAQHKGLYPETLGELVALANGNQINCFQTPGDERQARVPVPLTQDWVSKNSSYVYLASGLDLAKADSKEYPAGNAVIAFHTKLDQPFDDSTHGPVVAAAYLDGHIEIQAVEEARRAIARSIKILDAAKQAKVGPKS